MILLSLCDNSVIIAFNCFFDFISFTIILCLMLQNYQVFFKQNVRVMLVLC